jgi:hypothetical protein
MVTGESLSSGFGLSDFPSFYHSGSPFTGLYGAFAIDVVPFNAHFIAREMRQDFLEQLYADIKALEEAISAQSTGRGHRRAAAAAIDVAIDDSNKMLNKLDALVRNKYRKDRATLAEWTTATQSSAFQEENAVAKALRCEKIR